MSSLADYFQDAVLQHQQGNLEEAERRYRQILQTQPNHAGALHLLGVIAYQVGKLHEANSLIRKAIQSFPKYAEAYSNLALVLKALGQIDESAHYCLEALKLNPHLADAHNNLGIARQEQGAFEDALQHFVEAVRLDPRSAESHNNLGITLRKLGRLDEAVAHYLEALRLRPNFAEAFNNLGFAYRELGRLSEALTTLERALELKPQYADALNNLGITYIVLNQHERARIYLQEAIRFQPEFADAHHNLGMLLLQLGSFHTGWVEYEWRWRCPNGSPMPDFFRPLWQGEPLKGRTILLHPEQGLGDILQFVRYALPLRAQGARVLIACQPIFTRLFRSSPAFDQVVQDGDPFPQFDVHAPLLSLPRLLGTNSIELIPATVPYLEPDATLVKHWHERLQHLPGFRIGICWQGNPTHKNDRWRSVPLSRFLEISQIPGVSLISLQKGTGREQLSQYPELALYLGDELTDLAETAAILRNLDLVICIDTALCHLAGALGVPTWMTPQFAPDWRWLLDREDSPWYPSLRLYRQPRFNDWDPVFARLRDDLLALLSNRKRFPKQIFDQAVVAHQAGRFEEAAALYREVLRDDPRHADTRRLLGLLNYQIDNYVEAEQQLRHALRYEPSFVEAHNHLGLVLESQGNLAEAEACHRQALRHKPEDFEAHHNLAILLQHQGKFAEAVDHYRQALAAFPNHVDAISNLGNAFKAMGRLDEAIVCYREAISRKPNSAESHNNLGICLLLQGKFSEGWDEYEWRWPARKYQLPTYEEPMWDGSSLAGRTIFVYPEQGLGDTLQFVRYLPRLKRQGATVLFAAPTSLFGLLQGIEGIDHLFADGERLPEFHVHAPLMSLARLCGTKSTNDFPAPIRFNVDPEQIASWKTRLNELPGFKIGIAWQGNPQHYADRWRSVSVSRFAPLAQIPGVHLVSLQKGPSRDQLSAYPGLVLDLTEELHDFADTAALISNLDLVITIDSSIAHLAGSLGARTWVALPFAPDWRWLLDREDSPWYPSVRLFRQPAFDAWDVVFERLEQSLRDLTCIDAK